MITVAPTYGPAFSRLYGLLCNGTKMVQPTASSYGHPKTRRACAAEKIIILVATKIVKITNFLKN